MKFILCGPPLTGKSYYGKKLAEALHWPFLDTDLLVEKRYLLNTGEQLTSRQISLKLGLDAFYNMEKEEIASLEPHESHQIISVGGKALEKEENAKKLKQMGRIIYLNTDVSLLLARLKHKSVIPAYLDPIHPEESYLKLVEQRAAAYRKYADLIVEIKEENERAILETLKNYISEATEGEKHGK